MIANWVKNILSNIIPTDAISQGNQVFERKLKKKSAELLAEIQNEAPSQEEVQKKGRALMAAMSHGGSRINRLKMWLGIRRKVKKGLIDGFDEIPGMSDEVTERILEAAEYDPQVRKLFR